MTPAASPLRSTLLAAGVFGLTGVALGAMGAHALKAPLMERGMLSAWETASRYHLFHAVSLVGLAALGPALATDARGLLRWAARCWVIGIILFSASLYWLALGGPRWLGPITPLGGVALMLGWLLVAIAAWKHAAK